jgi:hypothetical protein
MAFRSPPPHRKGRGNLGNKLTKGGKPNKYTPHTGKKQTLRQILKGLCSECLDSPGGLCPKHAGIRDAQEAFDKYKDQL